LAIAAWRKQQRIDLLRTIAVVTASVNPEKANAALRRLIEETFPEVAKDRDDAVERAMAIMEKEKNKTYSVAPVGSSLKGGKTWRALQSIISKRRRR
jgi:predicted CoA-binding protein